MIENNASEIQNNQKTACVDQVVHELIKQLKLQYTYADKTYQVLDPALIPEITQEIQAAVVVLTDLQWTILLRVAQAKPVQLNAISGHLQIKHNHDNTMFIPQKEAFSMLGLSQLYYEYGLDFKIAKLGADWAGLTDIKRTAKNTMHFFEPGYTAHKAIETLSKPQLYNRPTRHRNPDYRKKAIALAFAEWILQHADYFELVALKKEFEDPRCAFTHALTSQTSVVAKTLGFSFLATNPEDTDTVSRYQSRLTLEMESKHPVTQGLQTADNLLQQVKDMIPDGMPDGVFDALSQAGNTLVDGITSIKSMGMNLFGPQLDSQ